MKKQLLVVFALFNSVLMFSQTTVSGTVTDANGNPLPGANIKVERKSVGTNTDFDGEFILKVTDTPPFNFEISMLGYKTTTVAITENNQVVSVTLTENATSLDEIVVSASRTPERIMESPVTVERMDARAIKNTSSPSFYDGLENLKGVDVNANSLTFKSVNTRGFATFNNTRFMQLVDGMDNSSPALNFALGNLLGMSELDVKTVELLPGAASALYGANAFNGIMFMTSKSPFEDQGISYVLKSGITSQEAAGDNNYYDTSIRMAYAFSDFFAAKATFSYLQGTEWHATDYRNTADGKYIAGDRASDKNFNGLNVYGDEVSTNLGGAIGDVSRTGYNESDLMTYDAKSIKLGLAFHYRPFGDDRVEVIWNSKYGIGNTIYQNNNRYNIKDFFMEQHKLEVKGKNFFVRGYVTSEDAGNSYDTRFAAININRKWKSDTQWFTEYAGAYFGTGSHTQARAVADTGRLEPGTNQFKAALNQVIADPSLTTGAKFQDNTKYYHTDANYNLKDVIAFGEIQVGGSYRKYSLNSNGSIFTDYDGPIEYDEYGFYTQFQEKYLEDRLKLTLSARYDKAQNFDGNVSPRASLAYAVGDDKNHNFRASFQTGFRNPTTQDQYIGLDAGAGILVGSAPDNLDRYTSSPLDVSTSGQVFTASPTTTLSGRAAYDNSFSAASITNGTFQKATLTLVKPEKVTAYEIGYRGLANIEDTKISVDLSVYYNSYEDFISSKNVAVPYYGVVGDNNGLSLLALQNGDYKGFVVYTNSSADISSYGASIGLNTKIGNGFDVGLNYTYAKFDFEQATDPDFEAGFNTPKHKVKFQFGKTDVLKNVGFNLNLRWQDTYYWESPFHDGTIAARTVLDAQVNYSLPKLKSIIKLGGANLAGKEYFSAPGVGAIGSQYFLSWTINN
jgi:outer membrane receptor protein involved in Fe transport